MKVLEAKVVVLGAQGVGKTSIIIRHTSKLFNQHVSPTIGASFFSCNLTVDDYRIRLQVWDTAGQERFRAMAPMYYRNANASFLVFDITSYESYMGMKTWVEELKRNIDGCVYICILGNKCDMHDQREVKLEEAEEYADMIGAVYVETSALCNDGIDVAFITLAKGLITMVENGNNCNAKVFDMHTSQLKSSSSPALNQATNNVSLTNQSALATNEKSSCC